MDDLKEFLKDTDVVDSHLHLGRVAYLNMSNKNDDNIIALLKRSGVKKAIVSHHGSFTTRKYGTKELFGLLDKYKGFLYGLLVFNPNHMEGSLGLINSSYSRKDIVGAKIHPTWHLCYPTDSRYEKFWDLAEEKKIPVLTHSWNPEVPNKAQKFSDPFLFENIIKKHPGLRLILAHAGGRGSYFYKVLGLLEKYPNLYVDFAADTFEPGLIEAYVERVGSGRILFGADMPWVDIRYHLVNILSADISEEDKKNILGLNSMKLFKI